MGEKNRLRCVTRNEQAWHRRRSDRAFALKRPAAIEHKPRTGARNFKTATADLNRAAMNDDVQGIERSKVDELRQPPGRRINFNCNAK